jgi:hypothetical protein
MNQQDSEQKIAELTSLCIDRGDAIDRLLSVLKVPLCYDNGVQLKQPERIEYAIRHCAK